MAKGKKCSDYFAYLNDTEKMCSTVSQPDKSPEEFADLDHLELALATRSAFFIREVARRFGESEEKSEKIKQNEIFAIEVQKMAK